MDRPAQIRAFTAELKALGEEGIALDEGTLARIRAHHEGLLVGTPDDRLSLGMRLASFVGAVALSCAVFFLFYRFWGDLAVPAQVATLVLAPLALIALTHLLHRWEASAYFATLAALAAVAAFILDLGVLGTIFNLPPTPHAFLAWGLFGTLLGWSYGLRLPHFAGLVCLGLWLTACPGWFRAEELPDLFGRGEALIVAGGLFLGAPVLTARLALPSGWMRWPVDHRIVGMIGLFLGLFILSVAGRQSWLPLDHDTIEGLYQFLGFVAGGGIVAWGVRDRHTELANGGMIFLTALCLLKATDWWWDWLPHWLFFLLLAGFAIGVMVALRRVRGLMTGEAR
ncbi:MAG TPA: DUF2157 domain-containing protein [Gemmatimonadales bacterium]|nr:DUF2157 domain-containing protein [Gemmatimonadales bacterium]